MTTSANVTRRQLQIARLLAQGFTHKEIAVKLGINRRTVAFHIHTMCSMWMVKNTVELIAVLYENEILM